MDDPLFPPLLVLIHSVSTLENDSEIKDLVHRHVIRMHSHKGEENDANVAKIRG